MKIPVFHYSSNTGNSACFASEETRNNALVAIIDKDCRHYREYPKNGAIEEKIQFHRHYFGDDDSFFIWSDWMDVPMISTLGDDIVSLLNLLCSQSFVIENPDKAREFERITNDAINMIAMMKRGGWVPSGEKKE